MTSCMLLAWRRLAVQPAEELLTEASISGVLDALGLVRNDETAKDLAVELRQLAATVGAVGMLVGAFAVVERRNLPHTVGCWFADAMLAQRLGWKHAVPLLGGETAGANGSGRLRRAATLLAPKGIEEVPERTTFLLAAQARAALRAVDLSADIGRRADRLIAVTPGLRARGADVVIDRILSDDAIVASAKIVGMSDRSLRRLFERLLELGAVRELSGRPAFRIYGDLTTMAEAARTRRKKGQPDDALFDRELDHLPAEARWREWMNRVEATIFAASEPVGRDTLARIVGESCSIDLLIDDIREELRGRPYDLLAVAGG